MPTTTASAPLFGVDLNPERTVPFRLRSYGPRDPDTGSPRETDHDFTARAEVDAATAIGTMREGAAAQAGVFIRFLQRTLLDDDGIANDETVSVVRGGEIVDPAEELPASPGTEVELAEAEIVADEYEIGGQRFPSRDLAHQYARDNGSSLRRFAELMDNPRERVKLDALREIVNYVAKEAGGRPTRPSTPSPKRQTRRKGR